MLGSNCYLLTWCRFLRRHLRWSGIPISLRMFQFVVIHTVKGFGVINEAEVDDFLELLCFLYEPMNVGHLISGSSASSKPSMCIWKFSNLVWRILSVTLLAWEMNASFWWFEYSLALPFFGIGMKIDLVQSCGPCQGLKFADILSAVLQQHPRLGAEIAQLESHRLC